MASPDDSEDVLAMRSSPPLSDQNSRQHDDIRSDTVIPDSNPLPLAPEATAETALTLSSDPVLPLSDSEESNRALQPRSSGITLQDLPTRLQPSDRLLPSTNPNIPTYRARLFRARRRHTDNLASHAKPSDSQALSSQIPNTDLTLREKVNITIQNRLAESGIDPTKCGAGFYKWMLPKRAANETDWNALLTNPLFVSTRTLSDMLSLEDSTSEQKKVEIMKGVETLFYIRTFAYKVHELADILHELLDQGMELDILFIWLELIDGQAPDATVFVRYCGATSGFTTWQRHQGDLRGRSRGFMFRFFQATRSFCPEVIEAAEVHALTDANIDFEADQEWIDLREQSIIALFSIDYLLNVQAGGHRRQYEPDAEDELLFTDLQKTTFQTMKKLSTGPGAFL